MEDSFYKESIVLIEGAIAEMLAKIDIIKKYKLARNERVPIEYITTRIKTEESMKEKLKRKGFGVTLENALSKIYDAAGVRIVCSYIDDVYQVVEMLKKSKDLEVIKERDCSKTQSQMVIEVIT